MLHDATQSWDDKIDSYLAVPELAVNYFCYTENLGEVGLSSKAIVTKLLTILKALLVRKLL